MKGPILRLEYQPGPAAIASRTSARVGCVPKSVTAQVAPACAQGSRSWPGGTSTITSNGSLAGRDSRICFRADEHQALVLTSAQGSLSIFALYTPTTSNHAAEIMNATFSSMAVAAT